MIRRLHDKGCVELQVLTVVIEIIFIRCLEILVTDMRRYIYKSA